MCRVLWKTDYAKQKANGVGVADMKTMCFCQNGKYKRWDEVRFNIERAYKMVIHDIAEFEETCSQRKRYYIQADSCVVGFLSTDTTVWSKAFMLGEDYDVTGLPADAVIVLVRVPTGKSARGSSRTNTYVPKAQLKELQRAKVCLLYTSPSPRDRTRSRMPSSA